MAEYEKGIVIDGTAYNVPLVSVQRTFDVLDKFAERNEEGILAREVLGVYANYSLSFGTVDNDQLYDKLVDKLTEPVSFHKFSMPMPKGTFDFEGYISQVSDSYEKMLTDSTKFQGLTCKFTMKEPFRRP